MIYPGGWGIKEEVSEHSWSLGAFGLGGSLSLPDT